MSNEFGEDPKRQLLKAIKEVMSIGISKFKSGEWFAQILQQAFKSYFTNATAEFFWSKYGTKDKAFISKKIIDTTVGYAKAVGAASGALMSTDEVLTLVGLIDAGLSLPANIALGAATVAAEALMLTRLQLKMIAELAVVNEVPLNPEDPEHMLLVLAMFAEAVGGELGSQAASKAGGTVARKLVRQYIKKDVLKAIKTLGQKVGVKILQKDLINGVVPFASIVISWYSNAALSRLLARQAMREFGSWGTELEAN